MSSFDGWEHIPDGWEQLGHVVEHTQKITKSTLDIDLSKIEYIFVPAGGITRDAKIHPWVERRLLVAKQIYDLKPIKIICLGGGSYHVEPIINKNGFVVHESTACAEYLIELGVNAADIYREWGSYDTIANGYFGFTNYITPLNIKDSVVITSEFHMPRVKAIFEWMKNIFRSDVDIRYVTASDKDLDPTVITSRSKRERNSLINLQNNVISKIDTVKKFHKWFFEDHKAYCSNIELVRTVEVSKEEKKSY